MGWTTDNDSKSKLLLPSTETVLKAFEMRKWTNTKQSIVAVEQQQTEATIVDHYNMAAEGSAGYIQHCGPFNAVCEEANIYQLWTKEYVENLGNYLIHQNPSIVLDVGAGDGLLIHYLQQHAKKRRNSISWIATDNGSWRIFAKAQVERLSVQQALETYASSKTIVLCSWMPVGVDWTKLFRQHQVQEYILIGEADDGSCGNQDTWGSDKDSPLYEKEGYQRWNMNNLLPFQFSRFDCSVSKSGMTVSFRRRHKMTSDRASL